MTPIEITIGILFATALVVVAAYFAWRQRYTLHMLRANAGIPVDQRIFLLKQIQRRTFGSVLLFLLAAMLVGSLFLDFDPLRVTVHEVPQVEREVAEKAVRFLSIYVMSMLLVLMLMLVLAVFDFWATARFGLKQRKQLLHEHQEMLEAELMEHRQRQAEAD